MCSKLLNCHSLRLHLRMKKVAKTGETETLPVPFNCWGGEAAPTSVICPGISPQEIFLRRQSRKHGKLSCCLKNVSPIQVSGYTSLYHFVLQLLRMLESPTVILTGVIYPAPCKLLAKCLWNARTDIPALACVFTQWPTPIKGQGLHFCDRIGLIQVLDCLPHLFLVRVFFS